MAIACAWHLMLVCQDLYVYVAVSTTDCTVWPGCNNERAAAAVLGYTPLSWDNFSGKEPQPASADKYWSGLTDKEKAAARVLGYTGKSWDNESGFEAQPTSSDKHWMELTSCGGFMFILLLTAQ